MGASRQAYWWERLLRAVPGMTMWCPDGNRHFRWQRVCWCRDDLWVSIRVSGKWVGFPRHGCMVTPMAERRTRPKSRAALTGGQP